MWAMLVLFTISTAAFAQDKAPSYFELDDYNHRFPETDTNIDMYLQSWQHSPVYSGSAQHGGWIERPFFTKGDPLNPPRPGAVLKYMKLYNHGNLDANSRTQKFSSDNEQVLFYIMSGEGRCEAAGQTVPLAEGSGIFIPAKVEYQFFNESDELMSAVVIAEEITADFEPLKEVAWGTYHDSAPRPGMHWAHISRGFIQNGSMKWQNPVGFTTVSIDAFDVAQPHMHGPGVEEIWCQVYGTSILIFGNQFRFQEPGMAFLIPPTFKVPHCSINHTGEPMRWLYMGNRHDDRSKARMEGHNPDWKANIYDKYDIEY